MKRVNTHFPFRWIQIEGRDPAREVQDRNIQWYRHISQMEGPPPRSSTRVPGLTSSIRMRPSIRRRRVESREVGEQPIEVLIRTLFSGATGPPPVFPPAMAPVCLLSRALPSASSSRQMTIENDFSPRDSVNDHVKPSSQARLQSSLFLEAGWDIDARFTARPFIVARRIPGARDPNGSSTSRTAGGVRGVDVPRHLPIPTAMCGSWLHERRPGVVARLGW